MNQLETNLVFWAICSILSFELLIIICVCRCCFNRIRPKKFYVKREEYEYMHGTGGNQSYFQSTILRPPHADELALIGTIRTQKPNTILGDGVDNFGFQRDKQDLDETKFISMPILSPPVSKFQSDWLELRSKGTNSIINTGHLPPAEYSVHSHPITDFSASHHRSPIISDGIDFYPSASEYDNENHREFSFGDDISDNFRLDSYHRPAVELSYAQRKDTSTESFPGHYPTLMPKSILKGRSSTTPPLHDTSVSYSSKYREHTPSKFDQSSSISIKMNIDEMLPTDSPINTIQKMIMEESLFNNESTVSPSTSSSVSSSNQMRFASVSRLNEIEWEVPNEFQTVVYDLTDDNETFRSAVIYRSNEDLNHNNKNSEFKKQSTNRQRTQSAIADQRTNISRIFIPWQTELETFQSPDDQSTTVFDNTQQQAFEY